MAQDLKRKRSQNFNRGDCELLASLVEEVKNVIENKRAYAISAKEKEEAWQDICIKFNANSSTEPRSAKVLREKFKNMMQTFKKRRGEESRYARGTGGGPFMAQAETSATDVVFSNIMEDVEITGLPAAYDCDAQFCPDREHFEEAVFVEKVSSEVIKVAEDNAEDKIDSSWTRYNPENMQKKKAEKLTVKNKKTKNIDNTIKDAQLSLIKHQIELCKNQTELCKKKKFSWLISN